MIQPEYMSYEEQLAQRKLEFSKRREELRAEIMSDALLYSKDTFFEAEFDGYGDSGQTYPNTDGKEVPVRMIGEQHVKEDFSGFIPTVHDWLKDIPAETWMNPSPAYQRQLMASISV